MKNFKSEVYAVMAVMADVVIDTEKFDQGNESAGRRARVALSKIAGRCVLLKREMMAATRHKREHGLARCLRMAAAAVVDRRMEELAAQFRGEEVGQ